MKREVSPKYELGSKRYGRRSLPVTIEDLEDLNVLDDDDIEVASSTKSLKHSLTVEDDSESEEVSHKLICFGKEKHLKKGWKEN